MTAPKAITLADTLVVDQPDVVGAVANLGDDRFFGEYVCDVSQITPGATLTVVLETADTANGFVPLVTLAAFTAPAAADVAAVGCRKLVRAHYTLVGAGATATVSFSGTSHQTFCNNKDLTTLSLPPQAVAGIPELDKAKACLAATDEAVSYLGRYYDLPVVSWGGALRLHVSNMAVYHLMKRRGFSPDNDPTIRMGYTDAIAWLNRGAGSDETIVDSTPLTAPNAAYMVSARPRGWNEC